MKKKIKKGYIYRDKQFIEIEIIAERKYSTGEVASYLCKTKDGRLINEHIGGIFLKI